VNSQVGIFLLLALGGVLGTQQVMACDRPPDPGCQKVDGPLKQSLLRIIASPDRLIGCRVIVSGFLFSSGGRLYLSTRDDDSALYDFESVLLVASFRGSSLSSDLRETLAAGGFVPAQVSGLLNYSQGLSASPLTLSFATIGYGDRYPKFSAGGPIEDGALSESEFQVGARRKPASP
jgi:hypothetical protein